MISGFSGAGKGTVSRGLAERYGYKLSVSATTRKPRKGEIDGRDYFFKTEKDFLDLVSRDGFVEYARYVDNYYGTPRQYVEDALAAGEIVLLEIEVQGAMKIREQYPDAILLFITAPSVEVLKDRLVSRGTESVDLVEKRMQRAAEEAEDIDCYDYIVCNEEGKGTACMEMIQAIIESENCRVDFQKNFIDSLRSGLKDCL